MSADFGFVSRENIKPKEGQKSYFIARGDAAKERKQQDQKDEEAVGSGLLRTILQIPQGAAEFTPPALLATAFQFLATGAAFDEEEIDSLERAAKRYDIPFDRDEYMQAAHKSLEMIPTVSNIAKGVEEHTGIPLEPKTGLQKFARLVGGGGKITPGNLAQKATGGTIAGGASQGLQAAGVPEPLADIAGLGVGAGLGSKVPAVEVSKATKPSGLPARQFENVKEPKEISASRFEKINKTLEKDFKDVSNKIIEESPIGETASNLKNDVTFKQQTRELLNEAQEVANEITEPVKAADLKKSFADISKKRSKGFIESEYDKSYQKFMNESIKDIKDNASAGQIVEQYRKNNSALSEYFEPGSSKALNRAKKDSLLDSNRALAQVMKEKYPDSHLSKVFEEGNARWTKIMDAEAVDKFVEDVFSGDRINFKKLDDFFDKQGYKFTFERALGKEGYKQFETLLKDMSTSEVPYKMLKIAKEKGLKDFYSTASAYILHPKIGAAKLGLDLLKGTYRRVANAMLDKPQIVFNLKKGIQELKKGDFKASEKEFNIIQKEIDQSSEKIK